MAEEVLVLRLLGKNEMSGPLKQAGNDVVIFRDKVRSAMADIKGLLAGLGVSISFGAAIKEGLQFNQVLEDANIGIAAVVGTLFRFEDAQGKLVEGAQRFAMAQGQSAAIMEKLKLAALTTTATFTQMVEGFQIGVGPMVRHGIAIKDTVEATQRLTQAMGALGVPMAQLGIEMRQFFEGDVARSRLLQGLGITAAEIRRLTASGGLMDMLREKTESIGIAGDAAARSFTGLASNLRDAMSQILGKGTEGLFATLKRQLAEFTNSIVTVDSRGFTFSPELLSRIKGVADNIGILVGHLAPLAAAFIRFGAAAGETLTKIFALGGPVIDAMTGILNVVTPLVDKFGLWAVAIWGVVKATTALNALKLLSGAGAVAGAATGGSGAWTGGIAGPAAGGAAVAVGGAALPIVATALSASLVILLPFLAEWKQATDEAADAMDRAGLSVDDFRNRLLLTKGVYLSREDTQAYLSESNLKLKLAALEATKGGVESFTHALERLRVESMTPIPEKADPAKMAQLAREMMHLNEQAKAAGLTGFSKELAAEATQYADAMAKLRKEQEASKAAGEKNLIGGVMAATTAKHLADVAAMNRSIRDEQRKLANETQKLQEEMSIVGLEGAAKELAVMELKLANEKRLSASRLEIAKRDKTTYAAHVTEENAKILGIEVENNAARLLITRKGLEEWGNVMSSSTVEMLRAQGDDMEAAMEENRHRYKAQLDKLAQDAAGIVTKGMTLGFTDTDVTLLGLLVEQYKAVGAAGSAAAGKIQRDWAVSTAGMRGDWGTLWDDIQRRVAKGQLTIKDAWGEMSSGMLKWGTTAADGITAAFLKIKSEAVSTTQATATLVGDLWKAMGDTFTEGFYDVLSGKFDSLKDVIKSFGDTVLKSFAKMLSDMLMKWISTQLAMKESDYIGSGHAAQLPAGGGQSGGRLTDQQAWGAWTGTGSTDPTIATGGGYSATEGAMKIGTGGLQGAAVGAAVGSASGAPGWSTGATIGGAVAGIGIAAYTVMLASAVGSAAAGATIGSVVPVIGTIIGAIIGGIVGILMAPNTETHVPFSARDVGRSTGGAADTGPGQFFIDSKNAIVAGLAGMFLSASPSDAAMLVQGVNDKIREYVSTMHFEVHAGSAEDIQKDFDLLMKDQIPKELMHVLFGNKRVGGQDMAGISGASKYSNLSDPDAPIAKLLKSLGFANSAIAALSTQIDTTDPKAFMDKLRGLIGIIVDANALVKDLRRSFSEVRVDIQKAQDVGPVESFNKFGEQIRGLAEQVQLYSGDEAIAKMQEVNKLGAQFRDQQVQALTQLLAMEKQWTANIEVARQQIENAFKDAGQLGAALWGTITANLKRGTSTSHGVTVSDTGVVSGTGVTQHAGAGILNAPNAETVQAMASQTLDAIMTLFQRVFAQLQQGKTLIESVGGLRDAFALGTAGQWDAANKDPFRVLNETQADISGKLAWAATLSGQAQLDVIADVKDEATAMYQSQLALLSTIHSNIVEMQRGFKSQIEDWQFSLLGNQTQLDKIRQKIVANENAINRSTDPAERARLQAENRDLQGLADRTNPRAQIDWIRARLEEDKAALAKATTPEEVKRLTDEIQKLGNQYVGMFATSGFGAGGLEADPNRAGAIDWMTRFLGTTQEEATAKYKAWEAEIQAHNDEMKGKMDAAQALLRGNVTAAAGEIDRLKIALDTLNTQVIQRLQEFGAGIVTSGEIVWRSIDEAAAHFKTAIDDPTTGVKSSFGKLGTAAEELANRLNKLDWGSGTSSGSGSPPTNPVTTQGPSEAFNLLRRNGNRLTVRMTGAM